jgi:hypothetical protein
MNKKIKTVVVATINGVDILACMGEDLLVPVKPICELFGVASNKQIEYLKSNPLFSSTGTLRVSVGADKKAREMYCLPATYSFAWMLGINAANVKEEVREKLLEYQVECVEALGDHFFGKRFKSFKKSAKLETRKQEILTNPCISEDLKEYLEINKEQEKEKRSRSNETRTNYSNILLMFSEEQMANE